MNMQSTLFGSILAALLLIAGNVHAGLLDGTAWAVDATPTRQSSAKAVQPFADVLTFSRGRVLSSALERYGIGSISYFARGGNGFYNWETAPILKKKRAAEWGGVINGGNIDGNLRWVTSNGRVLYFTIKGRKR